MLLYVRQVTHATGSEINRRRHRARPPTAVRRGRCCRETRRPSATRRCPAATAATCRSSAATAAGGRRQLELERLPVGVQDQVERPASPAGVPRRERDAVRVLAPVRLVRASRRARPCSRPAISSVRLTRCCFVRHVAQQPPREQQRHEAVHVGVLLRPATSRTSSISLSWQ